MSRLIVTNGLFVACAIDSSASETRVCIDRFSQKTARRGIVAGAHFLLIFLLFEDACLCTRNASGISGRVTDQQGLAISGAEIDARGDATGSEARSIADSEGDFAIGSSARPLHHYGCT